MEVDWCLWCYGSELAANLDRQVKTQQAGPSQKEMADMKMQMEKDKNSLIFENFKQRNVREYWLFCSAAWSAACNGDSL